MTIKLNDALFNAAVLGFIRVLDHCNVEYVVDGNCVTINSEVLDNFHKYYFQALIKAYRRDCSFYKMLKQFEHYSENVQDETDELKNFFDYAFKNLESASYKSGYEIVNGRGNSFSFADEVKIAKKEKSVQTKLSKLSVIFSNMREHKEVFLLKNIMYTKINKYWQNKAFLNKGNNKKEIEECFETWISTGLRELIKDGYTNPKTGVHCSQCGELFKTGQMESMAWLLDVGVDTSRKVSNYWNFKSDTNICPICTMIYTCLPLGFTIMGSEGIFINANYGIDALKKFNGTLESKLDTAEQAERAGADSDESKNIGGTLYYSVLNNFMEIVQNTNAEYSIDNVQVIRRIEDGYSYNVLSKNVLSILREHSYQLSKLVKASAKVSKLDWVNLYKETLEAIWQGRNMYAFLYKVIKQYISEGNYRLPATALMNMLIVQKAIQYQGKGGKPVKDGILYVARAAGADLREAIGKSRNTSELDNKIKSVSYNLINSLRTVNKQNFIDILVRQYIGLGMPTPEILVKFLSEDDELFLSLGYAFVLGLNTDKKQINEEKAGGEKS